MTDRARTLAARTPAKDPEGSVFGALLPLALKLVALAWIAMFVVYALLFHGLAGSPLLSALRRAAINTLPAAGLAWIAGSLMRRHLIDAPFRRQMVGHAAMGLAFALLWYVGIQVGYGLQSGWISEGISGRALSGAALSWQTVQGLVLYGAVAGCVHAFVYLARLRDLEAQVGSRNPGVASAPSQIFIRDGKTIRPVALDDILFLSAAGDYTEVHMRDGMVLASTGLSDFERDLPDARFLRVHRSRIVRTDAILSMESAGNGCLMLHLPRGHSIKTSRAGATAFRERAV
ncbi:MAG: LytTR family DNA-binding domain-containing protein [Litorimonas sp.]